MLRIGLLLLVAIGVMGQTQPPTPKHMYDVVSIRPSKAGNNSSSMGPGPQGGMRGTNITTMQLLTFAYDRRELHFIGGPGWVKADRYDVTLTPDTVEVQLSPTMSKSELESFIGRNRERTQAVLRDRFGLVLKVEEKEMPIYAMQLAKGGHKLTPTVAPSGHSSTRVTQNKLSSTSGYLTGLAETLSNLTGRPVVNETGVDGPFDFQLEWAPEGSGAEGASLFTALTEQLGLRLEAKKGPVKVFVIEKIEKPSEN
jgi:uncharacterized protein (TIGR03435 family)